MDFITFRISLKTNHMKLRLSLLLFCLLGIGVFSHSQETKKVLPPPPPPAKPAKPTVLNGPDAIPITVKSSKKVHWKIPPPPPPKVEAVKFTPPKIVRDVEKAPPPPPAKPKVLIKPDMPPKDQRA